MLAAYVARSGPLYTDDTHAGCLYAAADREPECRNFPHGEWDIGDIESRTGFVDAAGKFYSRDETLTLFGFDLTEDAINFKDRDY